MRYPPQARSKVMRTTNTLDPEFESLVPVFDSGRPLFDLIKANALAGELEDLDILSRAPAQAEGGAVLTLNDVDVLVAALHP